MSGSSWKLQNTPSLTLPGVPSSFPAAPTVCSLKRWCERGCEAGGIGRVEVGKALEVLAHKSLCKPGPSPRA